MIDALVCTCFDGVAFRDFFDPVHVVEQISQHRTNLIVHNTGHVALLLFHVSFMACSNIFFAIFDGFYVVLRCFLMALRFVRIQNHNGCQIGNNDEFYS